MSELLSNSAVLVAGVLLVAMAFLGVGYAVFLFLNPKRSAKDRVRDLTGSGEEAPVSTLVRQQTSSSSSAVVSRLGKLATSNNAEELNQDRLRMVRAGYRSASALEVFNAIRVVLFFGLPILAFLILPSMKLVYLSFFILLFASVGYIGPSKWVDHKVTSRQESIMRPFPDALDLLVSSVEAGLGLDAAFMRVADEMTVAAPVLAAELQSVNREVNAGIPRVEALRRLDMRTGLSEINALVNVLIQADRFGTPISAALRTHAGLVRTRRMQEAEERAAKISPKMTVAMILFLLPALFVVILGPAIVNVIRRLLPTLGV